MNKLNEQLFYRLLHVILSSQLNWERDHRNFCLVYWNVHKQHERHLKNHLSMALKYKRI